MKSRDIPYSEAGVPGDSGRHPSARTHILFRPRAHYEVSVSGRFRDPISGYRLREHARTLFRGRRAEAGIVSLALLCVLVVAAGYVADPGAGWVAGTLARLHPVVVHLPIGFLLGAALFEVWGRISRHDVLRLGGMGLLAAGVATAAVSVAAGFMLSREGAYDEAVLFRHQVLGLLVLAVAFASLALGVLFRARSLAWDRAYGAGIALVVLLVTAAGHFGGALTHGPDYLTERLPSPLRSVLGLGATTATMRPGEEDVARIRVFDHLIAPALAERCVGCHGPSKHDGDLRLDSYTGLLAGGEGGPAVAPGNAAASELVRRITLPAHHEDHMPPSGRRPLTVADADLIRLWIDAGADTAARVSDLPFPESMSALVEAFGIDPLQPRTGIFALDVAPPDPDALSASRDAGWQIAPLSERVVFLDVRPGIEARAIDDGSLDALEQLAANVAWLDLRSTSITNGAAERLARLTHLVRLRLDHTAISAETIESISSLPYLSYLNLVGTRVDDGALEWIAEMTGLRAVYVWRTAASEAGVARLRESRPKLSVVAGPEAASAPAFNK